jgi:ATP-dependent RNA helicase SUPV3L1/SUV3
MTSLTGSAGEDFASVLRALGYRMERRPPPPKPVVVEAPPAETAAESAPTEAASETATETPAEGVTVTAEAAPAEFSVAAERDGAADITTADITHADITDDAPQPAEEIAAPSATLLPSVAFSPDTSDPAAVEAKSIETLPEPAPSIEAAPGEAAPGEVAQDPAAAEPTTEIAAEAKAETVAASDAAPAAEGDAVAAAPETAAVPELIEVWRPGGRSEERRPRHDRNRHRHQDRPAQEGAAPAAATGEAGEVGEGAKRERHRRGRRDRGNEFRKPRTDAPAEAATTVVADGAPVREPREDKGRPPRERFEGRDKDKGRDKGKFGGGRDKGGRDKGGRDKRPDGGPSHRQYATTAPPRERERPIDPNSPFAKLAALKEQLTANRKDR